MFKLNERGSIGTLLVVIIMVALVAVFFPTAFDNAVNKTRQYVYGVVDKNRSVDGGGYKADDSRYKTNDENKSVQKQNNGMVQAVQREQVPVEGGQYRAVIRGTVVSVSGGGFRPYVTAGVDDGRGGILTLIGFIDTGAPNTYVAARKLESIGYTPVSGVINIEGTGACVWFEIPALYINTGNGKWVKVADKMRVIGEVGKDRIFSDTEIFVGMDVIARHYLYVTGNEWVLGVK